ncbi:phage baseplate assembly protein W [Flavobacterium gossypii]|jgi:Gene 25-like lysozyme.|uniref:Gene 25-like lysozyme n=2 Tax=Flavobacterium TaxID=237 RepID=A0A495MJ45_9FLAO|nr:MULTISPECIES: GPW/gp25 family protein [Flavobacterium]MBA9073005.1 phage baseplate assembly protein W [Flavobacterium gossypii]RKS26017.1 gene 25-like lysozyme [Flavobacterium endophyticum]WDO13466.1 GPW/gp25 family protein [Flavobacterium sp. WW92]
MKDLFYKIPIDFKRLSSGEDLRKVTIEESLAQYISLIITTIFGEYKYDDEFGTVIWETDFNLLANANQLKDMIKESVHEKVKKYEKRLIVTDVTLGVSEDTVSYEANIRVKKRLDIVVYGVIKKTNQPYYYKSSYFLAPFSFK